MARSFDVSTRPIPALIAIAFSRVTAQLMDRVEEAGFDDLERHHFLHVFRFMEPGGSRPAHLAKAAGITPQAMSLILNELAGRGYIERTPDPHDRRSHIVTWARRGIAAGAVAEEWFNQWEAHLAKRVGAQNVAAMREALVAIAEEDLE